MKTFYIIFDLISKTYYTGSYWGEIWFSEDVKEAKKFPNKDKFWNYDWEKEEAHENRILEIKEILSGEKD